MEQYKYRPLRFYITCFAATWAFWISAAAVSRSGHDNGVSSLLMLLGLIAPAVTAVITVQTSGNKALKDDLKRKLVGFYRIKPLNILAAVVVFVIIVALSVLLSLCFGQTLEQFAFTEDFSFSIGGTSALLTILLSVSPLGFLTTWVYVKNNRSMLACIIFHLFVNTMQEKIAMTPQTKCVETLVVTVAAVLVVAANREMFFEKEHIGRLLEYQSGDTAR